MGRFIFDMLVLSTQFHSKWAPAVPRSFGPTGPWERHQLQNPQMILLRTIHITIFQPIGYKWEGAVIGYGMNMGIELSVIGGRSGVMGY